MDRNDNNLSSARVETLLDRMTVQQKVGQIVMALNAPGWPGIADTERLIRDYGVGSVISCGYRGLDSLQAAERNNLLQALAQESGAGVPLLNGGDFEQGVASQVPQGATALPHQMGLAATCDGDVAERAATITGAEARALGFAWIFGPVVDVNSEPANPVIGVRSFGDDPQAVADLAVRQIAAYRRVRVLPTVKHFPGHGAAASDSHLGLPAVSCDRDTLVRTHLPPFAAAIRAGVDAVMTAHVVFPALDPDLPATLSHRILTGLLRRDMGYRGIVVTDLMSMGAITADWDRKSAAVMAVQAGADVVMMAGGTEESIQSVEALIEAVETGEIPPTRIEDSARRILDAKDRLGLLDDPFARIEDIPSAVGTERYRNWAKEMYESSITVVRDDGTLPLSRDDSFRTLVAGVTAVSSGSGDTANYGPLLGDLVREASRGDVAVWTAPHEDPSDRDIREAAALAGEVDRILVFTFAQGALPAGQIRLVDALARSGPPLVTVSLGTPYDPAWLPAARTAVATYALAFTRRPLVCPDVVRCAVDALFGAPAPGSVPVRLPNSRE